MKFKINSYIYFCQNMTEMTQFYSDIFGLKIRRNKYHIPGQWVELAGSGFTLCLHRSPSPAFQGNNKNKLVFDVDNVGAAREYLVARGVKMGKHQKLEIGEICDGKDTEGNRFQIACKRKDA